MSAIDPATSICMKSGSITDKQMKKLGVPESEINRDGKALVHQRAVWMNNGNAIQARTLEQAKAQSRESKLQVIRQMKAPAKQFLAASMSHRAALKKEKKFCYCETKQDDSKYVKCSGSAISRTIDKIKYSLCPFPSGWIHTACLEKMGESYDEGEDSPYYCAFCSAAKAHAA